jgi:hypothetical protein
MSDQEVFSNPDNEDQDPRESKINSAFGSLRRSPDEPLNKEEEERLRSIREAVATGDRTKVEEHLASVKKESSWLYEELTKHPDISAIFQELSIMGF